MQFAFNPDDAPPRLIRYLEPGILPEGVLCQLDRTNNLLIIDRGWFDTLTPIQQSQTLRTRRRSIEMADLDRYPDFAYAA